MTLLKERAIASYLKKEENKYQKERKFLMDRYYKRCKILEKKINKILKNNCWKITKKGEISGFPTIMIDDTTFYLTKYCNIFNFICGTEVVLYFGFAEKYGRVFSNPVKTIEDIGKEYKLFMSRNISTKNEWSDWKK